MKLLILSPYPIYPLEFGGKIRIVRIARALTNAGIDVRVAAPLHPLRFAKTPREPFRTVFFAYPFLLAYALKERPFPYGYWASVCPGLGLFLRREIRGADIVQFEHPFFASLLDAVPSRTKIVYDAHNVEADYIRDDAPWPWAGRFASRRIARLEGRLMRKSDLTLTCSEEDAQRLSSLYGTPEHKSIVIPNGVERVLENGPKSSIPLPEGYVSRPVRALFSGSAVGHNREAVEFILKELAPEQPDAGFLIHGSCGTRFRRSNPPPNAYFVSDSESFNACAQASTVALNPVRLGSGTNLKVGAYLASGLPVVSTPFGSRGYRSFEPYIRVAERADFAAEMEKTAQLPRPPAEALEKLRWDRVCAPLLDAYEKISKA